LTPYVDSSFLVAFYVLDAHSQEAIRRMASKPEISLTPFNRGELANAIYRQQFHGRPAAFSDQAWHAFESDCSLGVWKSIPFPEHAWTTCVALARRYGPTLGVRTLDTLHVACALELKAQRFWTFDERQARLAKAVGFDTEP
jgi:predicted nucleic acid-binding protein